MDVVAYDYAGADGIQKEKERAAAMAAFNKTTMPILFGTAAGGPDWVHSSWCVILDSTGKVVYAAEYEVEKAREVLLKLAADQSVSARGTSAAATKKAAPH